MFQSFSIQFQYSVPGLGRTHKEALFGSRPSGIWFLIIAITLYSILASSIRFHVCPRLARYIRFRDGIRFLPTLQASWAWRWRRPKVLRRWSFVGGGRPICHQGGRSTLTHDQWWRMQRAPSHAPSPAQP
ncbi:hypothetical protein LR48_Vigan07g061700 [Vigna angularis]|uniref:Uncharacterized protein n=1 Tax=Phaseolus angularis TaxID=3914 RepID=A0A0L9UVX7_PHAAN|nr:hypothetical protein LR48_Vigan07g061700 [Vigna angularis]